MRARWLAAVACGAFPLLSALSTSCERRAKPTNSAKLGQRMADIGISPYKKLLDWKPPVLPASSPRAGSADWLQHLMEPTNSGAVVPQALLRHSSCVIACELHQNWFEWQRGFTGRQGKNKRSLLPVCAAPAVHRGVL